MAEDYYKTLGIPKSASADEIKKAYRKLAHEHHPDKGSANADKFKEVNEAYQVLSNSEKRRQYDQFGAGFQNAGFSAQGPASGWDFSNFAQGFGGGVEFEDAFDIFSDIFGGGTRTTTRSSRRERGVDLEMRLHLKFEEAAFGVEKEITLEKKDVCEHCQGSGSEPGAKISNCPKCHGTGQIKTHRRTIFGNLASTAVCETCDGSGKISDSPCRECKGAGHKRKIKTLKIKIPAGVDDGSRIRVSGEGEVGYRGSNFGDLYLVISVQKHPKFTRENENIFSEVPISFYQAALGAQIEAETLDGKVELKIPAGTQSGRQFRLKNRGVPYVQDSGRGDHFITVRVVTPTKLTKKEKELFKKLAEEKGEGSNPQVNIDKGFWSKF